MKKPYRFSLTYDTKKTKKHRIDAEELGQSILDMAAIIKEGDKILNGEAADAVVKVEANSEGSFAIEFIAWLNEGGINVLQTLGITASVGAMGSSMAVQVIKQLKNRKIKAKIRIDNTEQWRLQLDDGEEIECSNEVEQLINNYSIRKKLDSVITSPTKGDESAIIKFTSEETNEVQEIKADDITSFEAPSRKSLLEIKETIDETNIVFVQVNFDAKSGWKVRLPNNDEKTVRMEDEAFIERINKRERSFIKGDMFAVKLKTVQKILDGKLSTSLSIEKVLRHRVAANKKIM